jgi:hypothetical protein
MWEGLSSNPLVLNIVAAGAVVAALGVIWKMAIRPFGRWMADAVKNLRRLADLMERMVTFLEKERDLILDRIDTVEQQNHEGKGFHEEIDRRVREIESQR